MFSALEIFNIGYQLEINGERTYRKAADAVDIPELKSLLRWMADQEIRHARWFLGMKEGITAGEPNPIAEEMTKILLNRIMGQQHFSIREVDLSEDRSPEELVELFLEFERDAVLFYEILQPFIEDDDVLKQINLIIAEEREHVRRLEQIKALPPVSAPPSSGVPPGTP